MYRRYKEAEAETEVMSSKMRVCLFLGSTREGRLGLRVAKFVQNQLEINNFHVDLFDPLVLKFPLLEKALHYYQDKSQAPKWMLECEEKIRAADAFVVVSAEYNHSIPPALANMMSHFGASLYSYKPSGIVAYSQGPYGGMRAAMQLRCFLAELGTLSVSNIFGIPTVQNALDENGKPLNEFMEKGATNMIQQLNWMAKAMKNHRDSAGVPK